MSKIVEEGVSSGKNKNNIFLRGRKTCLFKEDLQAGTNKRERKTIDQFWGGRKIYLSRINGSD
jgi:hypothetical protein